MPKPNLKSQAKRKREQAKLAKRQAKEQERAQRKAERTGSADVVATPASAQPALPSNTPPFGARAAAASPLTFATAVQRWKNSKVAKPR